MRAEQYEIWVENRGRWELVCWFASFDVASSVFANRTYRQRLIHATYENGTLVQQEVLAEVGRTREEP
jgi:hypothetical protein